MCIQKSREKESREIGISGPFSRPQCFPISNKIFFLVHTGILLLGFLYKSQLFQFPANRRLFGIRCTHKHLLLHWNSAETDIRRKTNRCWFPFLSKSLYKWWIFFFFFTMIFYICEWRNFNWNLDFFESNFRGDEIGEVKKWKNWFYGFWLCKFLWLFYLHGFTNFYWRKSLRSSILIL